jgi:MoaA/NifB/PqqE/SkfB family radical SAM enzyme
MANIGYIQVVRHCNHFCGFCSNPTSAYVHTAGVAARLVDDLVGRDYYGVVLTGGEPSLHPELPEVVRYAKSRGLHVRMITNGSRMADPDFAARIADAGLDLVHVSIYSVRPDVEEKLRGMPGTLDKAFGAIEQALRHGIPVNVNCVINKLNADHLDETVAYLIEHHPGVRHFVWNNLDPSMGRAEVNQDLYLHRMADLRASLYRALRLLHLSGRTFRVERVPLCYMPEFAWASTETRKIVKGEERLVHFLDAKQTVRQQSFEHVYAATCHECSVRNICGGLFERGAAYDPAELHALQHAHAAHRGAGHHRPERPKLRVPRLRGLAGRLRGAPRRAARDARARSPRRDAAALHAARGPARGGRHGREPAGLREGPAGGREEGRKAPASRWSTCARSSP